MFSIPINTIDNAINGSTIPDGGAINPFIAIASVILCATVKQVTCARTVLSCGLSKNIPSTNKM